MLHLSRTVYDEDTADDLMPERGGAEVARELNGRLLIRYVRRNDVLRRKHTGAPLGSVTRKTWVTPTPYTPLESISALNLPAPGEPRTHAILLFPARIPLLRGPRRVLGGSGIEYLLIDGYPEDALRFTWEQVVSSPDGDTRAHGDPTRCSSCAALRHR